MECLAKLNVFINSFLIKKTIDQSFIKGALNSLKYSLDRGDQEQLCTEVTLPEIDAAIKSFSYGKTPGSDGLPAEFYREFWDVLRPDLFLVFKEAFKCDVLPLSWRSGLVSLIFKKGAKSHLANWRPITLLNVDYKLMSKVLVNRFKGVLSKVIYEDQVCGVPGRGVAEHLNTIRDVIWYQQSRSQDLAILSLDFQKAFDPFKLNIEKCDCFARGNWSDVSIPDLPIQSEKIKILGVVFDQQNNGTKSWDVVREKVQKKIDFWKLRKLTIEGKVLIIKALLLPIMLYLSYVYPPSDLVAKKLQRMLFEFIWSSKFEKVKRKTMHKPHHLGGKDKKKKWVSISLTCPVLLSPPKQYVILEKVVRLYDLESIDMPTLKNPRKLLQQIRKQEVMAPISYYSFNRVAKVWKIVNAPYLTNQHKDLAWMIVQECLPTRDFQYKRRLSSIQTCPRHQCNNDETTMHLIWNCDFAQQVWKQCGELLKFLSGLNFLSHEVVLYGIFFKHGQRKRKSFMVYTKLY
ncbi:unnamed protein product [Ranitomeya imitator]|uniref:Reverse transcriptase domain-containing protein n=1 Tax=Ranitomeya imitator TaxID=111125 RepID=A0ABN9LTA1_9NEOB|nr:unnamed protein product [Ranitomeya imitator]